MLGIVRASLGFALMALVPPSASAQITFNVTNSGTATPQMMTGFQEAANLWSTVVRDPITVNVKVAAGGVPAGTLGATTSFFDPYSYSSVRSALVAGATSAADISSTNALQAAPTFSMLINRTANNPNGVVSATPYFDTGLGGPGQAGPENNNTIRLTSANAKALGLLPGNSNFSDGTIAFSTAVTFDFDRSNGITAGQYDFVGLAAHEIGHLLGFTSGVELLISNAAAPGKNDNQLPHVTALDLFRFSTRSTGAGGGVGVIDWTADTATKYFSTDGGLTPIANFSTGSQFGDGNVAGHWKVNAVPLGIMDPTIAPGEFVQFSVNDLMAFDVIGYDLTPVPEPSSCLLVGLASLGLLRLRCARRGRGVTKPQSR
jgi:hypothetical protein